MAKTKPQVKITQIAVDCNHVYGLGSDGKVYYWSVDFGEWQLHFRPLK